MGLANSRGGWSTVQAQWGHCSDDATCPTRTVQNSSAESIWANERRLCNCRRIKARSLEGVLGCLPPHPACSAGIVSGCLAGWGHTWLWNKIRVVGGTDWLSHAIAGETLVAVTDGSYIREHYPELCSAAFILECTQGGGHVTGAFPEALIDANAF
jgi:hypothetical protein